MFFCKPYIAKIASLGFTGSEEAKSICTSEQLPLCQAQDLFHPKGPSLKMTICCCFSQKRIVIMLTVIADGFGPTQNCVILNKLKRNFHILENNSLWSQIKLKQVFWNIAAKVEVNLKFRFHVV
jgi:hypothetical protein